MGLTNIKTKKMTTEQKQKLNNRLEGAVIGLFIGMVIMSIVGYKNIMSAK